MEDTYFNRGPHFIIGPISSDKTAWGGAAVAGDSISRIRFVPI
jgi:hypothetical protein